MLFIVMNPISTAIFFAGAAGESSREMQRSVAIKSILVAFGILLGFALGGDDVLRAVGIRLFSLKIAGGLLLFLVGLQMVLSSGQSSEEQANPKKLADQMVFPLAMPIMAGPAAILTTVILIKRAGNDCMMQLVVVGLIALILLVSLFFLLISSKIAKALGSQGSEILSRILGLLLCSLAVEMVIDGLTLAHILTPY